MTTASQAVTTTTATSSSTASSPNTWTELSPSGELPIGRHSQSMVYDPTSGKMIMFGGSYGGGVPVNETWAYDPTANRWTNLSPSGTLPSERFGQAMVYDPSTHRVIMFGGASGVLSDTSLVPLKDTWAYNPTTNTWTELHPVGTLPSARAYESMVYDPLTQQLIMFGGAREAWAVLNDTWAYDPAASTWTELNPSTQSPSGELPFARSEYSMVYDPSTHWVIMFAGFDGRSILNDTWTYTP